ncbi:MAG: saccharopine dehydrogenase C-terminal domain-containing protein [Oleiphilaceae bacterium]|nr:saccharopine dehydrogenase C-terminal domain-containing protein [Oleiphilaceae bacterium]
MTGIALFGAGKIGAMIAELLHSSGDYDITVLDQNETALQALKQRLNGIHVARFEQQSSGVVPECLKRCHALINAGPFHLSEGLARMANTAKVHYLDLTEDVRSTRSIRQIAAQAETAFIPQCGLAPGFIGIVAYDIARQFEQLHNVHMRVGALPQFPSNGLKYNLTWSTDGLINEYINPCEAIVNGEHREVRPLEELEHFSLDGADYEAFNTSGGLGTLCETLSGKVRNLNYRTVRYPGHRDAMKLLIQDLRLGERPALFKEILEHALPVTMQDVVLIFVSVSGYREQQFQQQTFVRKIYSQLFNGQQRSAIQLATASSICAVLELLLGGDVPQSGFVKQEQIPLEKFLANRFGQVYADAPAALSALETRINEVAQS